MLAFISSRYRLYKRANRIAKLKDKLPPYVKKEFDAELNYKIWVTKGARYQAHARCLRKANLSSKTIGYLSAYLIIVNLFTVYDVAFISPLDVNSLGFVTTSLSILILVFSQFETANKYEVRALRYHDCANELSVLYNELRQAKTLIQDKEDLNKKIVLLLKRYDSTLAKYENHEPIDFEKFQITKPKYFNKNLIRRLYTRVEYFIREELLYFILIIGPIILYILFQLKAK
jgi:hypothetical protein